MRNIRGNEKGHLVTGSLGHQFYRDKTSILVKRPVIVRVFLGVLAPLCLCILLSVFPKEVQAAVDITINPNNQRQ